MAEARSAGDDAADAGAAPALASPLRRLAARIVDALILAVVHGFLWVLGVLGSLGTQGVVWDGRDDLSFGLPFGPEIAIIAAAVGAVYETGFIAYRGQTPGKMLLGIMVADVEGGGFPSISSAFVRWLLPSALGVLPFVGWLLEGVAYAWLLVDPRRQGWHDKAARTIVVRAP